MPPKHPRKPQERKKKPETTTTLDKQCLALWGQIVKARDKVCRISQSQQSLSPHHIRSRGHANTRFDLSNGMCLSWGVHRLQKLAPERFQDMVIECIGDEEYQRLKALSMQTRHRKIQDFRDERDRLRKELTELSMKLEPDTFDDLNFDDLDRVLEETGI